MIPDSNVQEYKTDFSWPAWFSIAWLVIIGLIFLYFVVSSSQPPGITWERNESEIYVTTIAGIAAAFGIQVMGWKRIVLDYFKKELRVQKLFDKLAGRTRTYSLSEIKQVEKRYHFWSRSEILFITFYSGKELKLNTVFLKKGYELDGELLNLNVK